MSSYDKVRGGKFSFKGGGDLSLGGVGKKKKKKKKSKDADALALEAANADGGAGETMQVGQGIGGDPGGDAKGKYEELFPYEAKRQAKPDGTEELLGDELPRGAGDLARVRQGVARTREADVRRGAVRSAVRAQGG